MSYHSVVNFLGAINIILDGSFDVLLKKYSTEKLCFGLKVVSEVDSNMYLCEHTDVQWCSRLLNCN